ncbi:hypothetical protein B9Z65_7951 [Elsinoe australis]|uniref:Uncharacterized protein n=1 Tax=Elsinoe australis TaxID=40998 RepID=A0A2P8A118_9PEZI|nr:hypothetical protein B9Z65_7951 [Elsinoe australis]
MELLAHISARTSNKDDIKFRAQARNYVIFSPDSRLKSLGSHNTTSGKRTESSAGSSQGLDVRDFAYVDDTQLAIAALESQLITSSLRKAAQLQSGSGYDPLGASYEEAFDRIDSTPSKKPQGAPPQGNPNAGGNHTNSTEASTQIRDQPDPSQSDLSITVPLQKEASSSPVPASSLPRWQGLLGDAAQVRNQSSPPKRREGSSSWSNDDLPVELPSTYSISDETSKGSNTAQSHSLERFKTPTRPRRRPSPVSINPVDLAPEKPVSGLTVQCGTSTPKGRAVKLAPPDFPANTAPGLSSRKRVRPASPDHRPSSKKESAADSTATEQPGTQPQSRSLSQAAIDTTLKDVAETRDKTSSASKLPPLSFLIEPPRPDTSIAPRPTTFMTPNLRALKEDPKLGLSDRYHPKYIARAIRPKERGYWTFTPSGPQWTATLEREFWEFMTRLIEGGNVGWGVWCVRTPSEESSSNGDLDAKAEVRGRLGEVRVFCWGEIVEHVYLLLYIASKSKHRKGNPVWCDASGEVVVRM